jgi:hypothetical protein
VPLHLTKVAFGSTSVDMLAGRIEHHAARGELNLTTRYLPKRHAEIVGGSLYWIIKHQLAARSPIIGFADSGDGRTHIRLEPRVILVHPIPRRAHQGWRYLDAANAPVDLEDMGATGDVLPSDMVGELAGLGLL